MNHAKPFCIPKQVVWDAYKRVKANKGSAGVDEESVQAFEVNRAKNLYKLWNRMSSGTYFPMPVRTVEIPKKDGTKRPLGIPTVTDRIAQMVVKMDLEPKVEPHFHPDSYGYRPNKSALEALGVARERCWQYVWVLDVDIKGFFDNIDHNLLMRAVRKHTDSKWVHLYIERWLKAPAQSENGILTSRQKGTPQGGVISPLLANIFLHYAFDVWMKKNYPDNPFERYADDIVVHCHTNQEARSLGDKIAKRLEDCKLELHLGKTKIVYCKSSQRQGTYPNEKFDFLGYTFRPRIAKTRYGRFFVTFSPAASSDAMKAMRQTMRRWCIHHATGRTLEDLAATYNPILRGWLNYYGKYRRTALHPTFQHLNQTLVRWARKKYKKMRYAPERARRWIQKSKRRNPALFAHWEVGIQP